MTVIRRIRQNPLDTTPELVNWWKFARAAYALLDLATAGLARAATVTVSSTADSGPNTLRAATLAHASGDTIEFSVTGTITLLSILPTTNDALTIIGPTGATGITISGGGTVQLMAVGATGNLNLQYLTLANGSVIFTETTPPTTVSARMVQLPTPAAPACGEWTINIEVAGIDSTPLGDGPFALVLNNPDGDTGCFDITNAIVGN